VRHTARRAAEIITVSEYSKQDIIETYGIAPARITVTPEAAAANFAPVTSATELERIRKLFALKPDYILSLGSLQPRKNLVRLIGAYSQLRRKRPEMDLPQLVFAGKRGWLESEIFRAAEQSGFSQDIVFTGYVADADLAALYSGAGCFVYPSYFEGFGLPVLEAMQCGVPVIAGDRTSLPEIVGDAGVLVDPIDEEALADAIARVILNPDFGEQLRVKGLDRAKSFNWARTARLTLQTYERAAQKS
jgi:glycosyltransferase involved in cell wall biosynthesis